MDSSNFNYCDCAPIFGAFGLKYVSLLLVLKSYEGQFLGDENNFKKQVFAMTLGECQGLNLQLFGLFANFS